MTILPCPPPLSTSTDSAAPSFAPQRLLAHLKKLGAPADCYLISAVDSLDGQTMNLAAALDAVIGIGVGTLVSCVPGKLALYEGEYGASERLILHRG
jgi:hypothetical protein